MIASIHMLFSLLFIPFIIKDKFFIISMLSSILIDVDHYKFFFFVIKNKTLSSKKFLENKKLSNHFCVFHSPYFILLLILFVYLSNNKILLYILIGFVYHLIFDLLYAFYKIIYKGDLYYKRRFFKKYLGL